MDIYCRFCGEPWDHDELHAMYVDGRELPYKRAAVRFRKLGCGAFDDGETRCAHAMVDDARALMAEALQELSDHPDDWGAI